MVDGASDVSTVFSDPGRVIHGGVPGVPLPELRPHVQD